MLAMRFNQRESSSRKAFIYLIPANDYFAKLCSTFIKTYNSSNSETAVHIIIPVYGNRFKESTASKYPKLLKQVSNIFEYWRNQFKLQLNTANAFEQYIFNFDEENINIVSAWTWMLFCLKDVLNKMLKRRIGSFRPTYNKNILQSGFEIYIDDILVDTYLRFAATPSFNPTDRFITDILHRGRSFADLSNSLFGKFKDITCFTSYTSYMIHGVFSRSCVKKQLTLITLGDINEYYIIHTSKNQLPSHSPQHHKYCLEDAMHLDIEILNKAQEALFKRTEGKYDESMPYMTRISPDLPTYLNVDMCQGNVVLFLHDFFDAPHIYQWMLFNDFWEWCYETLQFCDSHEIPIFVKPHPNQIEESKVVTKKMQNYFDNSKWIYWLDPKIPNVNIFKKNPSIIVSVYGSISAEACFSKQKVLLAGDHPAINFKVGFTAKTKESYFNTIKNPKQISRGTPSEAIYFTALHCKNIFASQNDSLWSHLSLNSLHDTIKINSIESQNYINLMTSKLIDDLKKLSK